MALKVISRSGKAVEIGGRDAAGAPILPIVRLVVFYLICAHWTGLVLPLEHVLFGPPRPIDPDVLEHGDPINQLLNALTLAAGFGFAIRWAARHPERFRAYWIYLLFASFCLASTAWSLFPDVTLRRGLALLATVCLVIEFVEEMPPNALVRTIALQFLVIALFSLFTRIFMKNYGLHPGTPDLKGIYIHKNVFGAMMAVAMLSALFVAIREPARRTRYLAMAGLFLFCNFLSFSTTTLLECLTYGTLTGIYFMLGRGGSVRILGIFCCVILTGTLLAFILFPNLLFALLSKDATLTGRTELWPFVYEIIAEKPLLGHGFEAFWLQGNPEALDVWTKLGWTAPHAHNGFLEMEVELGYIGCGLFILVLAYSGLVSLRLLRLHDRASALLVAMPLIGAILFAFTEGTVVGTDLHEQMLVIGGVSGIWALTRGRSDAPAGSHSRITMVTPRGEGSAASADAPAPGQSPAS